uniref:alpha,alpha-trehalose-phosphate synthase (UDP-forming) n=1 Tax=Strongyloides stercoralis TaxID=6248 RepID=A0A0K0E6E6_STRER
MVTETSASNLLLEESSDSTIPNCNSSNRKNSYNNTSLPFERSPSEKIETPEQSATLLEKEVSQLLVKLNIDNQVVYRDNIDKFISDCCVKFYEIWKSRCQISEIALKGLVCILEYCLVFPLIRYDAFEELINTIGFSSILFWKNTVPLVYESDLSAGTQYRDSLLFSLELYDVNNGKNKVRELYAAVPGMQQSLLGMHAKRFGERFKFIQHMRSRRCSKTVSSANSLSNEDICITDNDSSSDGPDLDQLPLESGGLADIAPEKGRVINVSNAPPVSVSRRQSGSWEIKQGSGGLVACVDPVMSSDKENIWLANLGIHVTSQNDNESVDGNQSSILPSTNSLGLPLIKQAKAGDVFHVLADDKKKEDDVDDPVERDMSLLNVLHDYNKSSYKLNPVIVTQDDYEAYYGGISNGLLWPALHNLPEYIVADYDNINVLKSHWCAYVRVNYQFALNAARNSRQQDFIWIHDYHLMLTGQMMKSLDSSLEVGFFLHIPFQPPENFMTKYRVVAEPIVRGILRFNKVGFQTHRDRQQYVDIVQKYITRVKISYDGVVDIFMVTYEGSTCSLGVFPVSIKNQDFIDIAKNITNIENSKNIKKEFASKCSPDGKLFFSVERFDYTKGIRQKLLAWKRYFEKYPDRIGKDTLFQVAVTNRRTVESYRNYQDTCMRIAQEINDTIKSKEYKNWQPVIFQTNGLNRKDLIAHYLAMDVGVVTPIKDGMNLVAKEMMICNSKATLVLSSGAGTEVQLTNAGLYNDNEKCYFRVEDINDTDGFADIFYQAASQSAEEVLCKGLKIKKFLMQHDIVEWSTSFLDPSWTHEVIRVSELKTLSDFYVLMEKSCKLRRQIVENILKGIALKSHFDISLKNAKETLEKSSVDEHFLLLKTESISMDGSCVIAKLDIKDQLDEFNKDIEFLRFIQSDNVNNVEEFVATLSKYHPISDEAFEEEVSNAVDILTEGDHFDHFFTDRDGTLKSYCCSYASSIQPAYSAVIQAQFARRCAQFCAIVTTAPLLNIGILNVSTMPEGYYVYGASGGREWYMNPSVQFKDSKIGHDELELLDSVFEKLEKITELPEYEHLKWIGSGIQKHYGHITIACQDKNESISDSSSQKLLEFVQNIVNEIDPIEETLVATMDNIREIKICIKSDNCDVIFNKGNGIMLIKEKMGLKLHKGNILVCGDAMTDLPMLEEVLKISPKNVYTIWVTTNESLKSKVAELCKKYGTEFYTFVSCPTVLLAAMAHATVRDIRIRPHILELDDFN